MGFLSQSFQERQASPAYRKQRKQASRHGDMSWATDRRGEASIPAILFCVDGSVWMGAG